MVEVINSGFCFKCKAPLTNIVDGMTRPFCKECEEELMATIKKGAVGKKVKNGKLIYPPAPEGD